MIVALNYTDAIVRKSVWRFCGRTIGWLYTAALLITATSVTWLVLSGDRSWLVGAVGTVMAMGFVFPVLVYYTQLQVSLKKLRALDGKPAEFEATTDVFVIRTAAGTSEMPWSIVSEIWQYGDCWLLLFSWTGFVTFPLQNVTVEMQAFVLERVQGHGGQIR